MDATLSATNGLGGIPNLPADILKLWGESAGNKIAEEARKQAHAVRVCQKVFMAELVPPLAVPDDSLDLPTIDNIPEKDKKTLVEITIPFKLTPDQMDNEPNTKIGCFLAQVDGRVIGQVEDLILFQGVNANKNPLFQLVTVKNLTGTGLIGAADPEDVSDTDPRLVSKPIDVPLSQGAREGVLWGEELFAAVNSGVTKLSGKGQSTSYALLLPIAAYADAQTPPGNQSLVTTHDRLKDWIKDIYPTAMLPPDRGLLVAVSNAIALYVGVDAQTEYTAKDQSFHNFLIRNKFQFIARDPRALVLLKFKQPDTAK